MGFTTFANALNSHSGKDSSTKKQVETGQLVEFAQDVLEEIFGEKNAQMAKPLFLKNRTLTITCLNSLIAQEIRLHQQEIVDKINNKLGKKEVDRIRYLT